jgi:hypothetical protein
MVLVDVMKLYAHFTQIHRSHLFMMARPAGPDDNEVAFVVEIVYYLSCVWFDGADVWIVGIDDSIVIVY